MTFRYYTPADATVFVPFWSDEAEAMFRRECPNASRYVFSYLGGLGLVYRVENGQASLPLTHDEIEAAA